MNHNVFDQSAPFLMHNCLMQDCLSEGTPEN